MKWQGSVNTPEDLRTVIPLGKIQALDGIFYTCRQNNGIYVLDSTSTANEVFEVIIPASVFPIAGRFIKLNDAFMDANIFGAPTSTEVPNELGTAFIRNAANEVYVKVATQYIRIGQWPV